MDFMDLGGHFKDDECVTDMNAANVLLLFPVPLTGSDPINQPLKPVALGDVVAVLIWIFFVQIVHELIAWDANTV